MIPDRSDPQKATLRGQGLQGKRGISNTMSPRICGELIACRSRPKIFYTIERNWNLPFYYWFDARQNIKVSLSEDSTAPANQNLIVSRGEPSPGELH
jgi:hypothetical protein